MFLRNIDQFYHARGSGMFNVTPVIDIVFLLIIFFSVVCRFIEAENFPVTVPDNCKFAGDDASHRDQMVTVTVVKTTEGGVDFAVGSEKIITSDRPVVVVELTRLIDVCLGNLPPGRRVVTLRIDRDICFSEAQFALAAVAASSLTDVKLAVLKQNRTQSD